MQRIRTHLSYANVAATLALLFAMSGGAIAATGGFTSGGKLQACAGSDGTLKLLKAGKKCKRGQKTVAWSQTGPAGARGASGAPGAAGAQGAQGGQGAPGTAVAYAHVTAGATLDTASSSGVVDVQRNRFANPGFYCLYGNFTAHVATATLDGNEATTGGERVFSVIGQTSACPASPTGAPFQAMVVIRDEKATASADAGFFIIFN